MFLTENRPFEGRHPELRVLAYGVAQCTHTTDYVCKTCRGRSSCPANHHLSGTCGGKSDYSCTPCPPHATSLAGAKEVGQCSCVVGHFDADTAAQGVECKVCKASCGTNEYARTECGIGDVSCATCPPNSAITPAAKASSKLPRNSDCSCAPTFFDDDAGLSVNCVKYPARLSSPANATCDLRGMQFGMKKQAGLGMTLQQGIQLSKMLQYLGGIDASKIPAADFNVTTWDNALLKPTVQYKILMLSVTSS